MPKVSVIVPVYGVEKYIERCARSLFEQTLDDIEYLFIDDCTPDRSIEILKNVLEEYPNRKSQVIIHRMEQNGGQAAVRKWGMLNATGDYVIHCDSDDWVDTDMYRTMYEKAKEDNADIVVCDYCQTDGLKKSNYFTSFETDLHKEDILRVFLREKYAWSVWNKLVRRTIYTCKDYMFPLGNMGEDMVLTIQCLLYSERISYIPRAYYYYYYNENSITQVKTEMSCFSKFNQYKDNVALLLNLDYGTLKFGEEFVCLKYHTLCLLLPLVGNNKYYRVWRNLYEGISFRILTSPIISSAEKIKYILTLIHLYPRRKDRILTI